jgi:hypothetical protein
MKKISVRISSMNKATAARTRMNFESEGDEGMSFRAAKGVNDELNVVEGDVIFDSENGIKFKPSRAFRKEVPMKTGNTIKVEKDAEGELTFEFEGNDIKFKPSRALKNSVILKNNSKIKVAKDNHGDIIFEGIDGLGFKPSSKMKRMLTASSDYTEISSDSGDAWWAKQSKEQKAAYIKAHPRSKYAKQSGGQTAPAKEKTGGSKSTSAPEHWFKNKEKPGTKEYDDAIIDALKQNSKGSTYVNKNDKPLFLKIKNPSERVQMEAVRIQPSVYEAIKNPSEKVSLSYLKSFPRGIMDIKNPSETMLKVVEKKDPFWIKELEKKNGSSKTTVGPKDTNGPKVKALKEKISELTEKMNKWKEKYRASKSATDKIVAKTHYKSTKAELTKVNREIRKLSK